MIYQPLSFIEDTWVLPIMPNQPVPLVEGMFVNKATDHNDGKTKLTVPIGSATELSAGIILSSRERDTDIPVVEELTFSSNVGGYSSINLSFTPMPANTYLAGPTEDILVVSQDRTIYFNCGAANQASITPTIGYWVGSATNQIIADGPTWGNQQVTVVYRRLLNKIWDKQYATPYKGLMPSDMLNVAGVTVFGTIYTSFYKTGDNWYEFTAGGASYPSTDNPMVVAAGGYLTNKSGAVGSSILPDVLTGCISIVDTPSVDLPFCAFRYTAN